MGLSKSTYAAPRDRAADEVPTGACACRCLWGPRWSLSSSPRRGLHILLRSINQGRQSKYKSPKHIFVVLQAVINGIDCKKSLQLQDRTKHSHTMVPPVQ